MELKVNKKYKLRRFINLKLPDLITVTVKEIKELGDGQKIVGFRRPFLDDMAYLNYEEFIQHSAEK